MTHAAAKIRALNDQFRRSLKGGMTVITPGIAALGPEAVQRIVLTVMTYHGFSNETDPYGEHDFGAFDAEGERIFFKIDYLDGSMGMHSPDPADPNLTQRVLTIMSAGEY